MGNLVGSVLQNGKYQIEQALGEGGFGITYRAVRMPLNQIVVIKTVNPANWSGGNLTEQQQQFQQEARRLAQCKHPNIVTVTDFFIEQGLPYLVMDYIPGKPLSEIVRPNQPLPEATALYYIQQVGEALQVVHRQGLLHRDVKPQNIMIHDLTGEAILIDFGIARELSVGQTQTHTSIVSDGYAPIEQYLPKARRSKATDVYGLAATLYTLVTGEIPVASVLRSHEPLVTPRQYVPALSAQTEQAILQGMGVELPTRPQSVATWLTLLKGSRRSSRSNRPIPGPSTAATQVVAPGHRGGNPPQTTAATVAVTTPPFTTEAPERRTQHRQNNSRRGNNRRPQKRKGNIFSTLVSLIALALLTGLGVGGYRLYQRASQAISDFRQQPIFQVELPDISDWVGSIQETLDNSTEPEAEAPADETIEERPEAEVSPNQSEPSDNLLSRLPMVLRNSGNPATATPGGASETIRSIPGFAPGTAASQVLNRLGEPTRQSIRENFQTAVYDLVPNRASVAYVYDQASETIQQAEASFAPSFDQLMMRVSLIGMLNGQSTKAIETGLEQVRTEQINSYDFEHGGFKGTIERNANGFIHIYVRPDS